MAIKSSGQLSLRDDIRAEFGTATTNVSLRGLSSVAGFSTPDEMSEFYGYSRGLAPGTYLLAQSQRRLDERDNTFNLFLPNGALNAETDIFFPFDRGWFTLFDRSRTFEQGWIGDAGNGSLNGRLVVKHEYGGTDYRGDVQIDYIAAGGLTESFEGDTLWETNANPVPLTSTTYEGVGALHGWQPMAPETAAGFWHIRNGTTPSGGTGRLSPRVGRWAAYCEASSGVNGAVWMRSPTFDFANQSAEFRIVLGVDVVQAGVMSIYFVSE